MPRSSRAAVPEPRSVGRQVDDEFVDEAGGQEGAQDPGAAFHHEVPDAVREQLVQGFARVAGGQVQDLAVVAVDGGVVGNPPVAHHGAQRLFAGCFAVGVRGR